MVNLQELVEQVAKGKTLRQDEFLALMRDEEALHRYTILKTAQSIFERAEGDDDFAVPEDPSVTLLAIAQYLEGALAPEKRAPVEAFLRQVDPGAVRAPSLGETWRDDRNLSDTVRDNPDDTEE